MNVIRSLFLCFCLVAIVFASSSCYKEPLIPYKGQKILVDSTCIAYFASYNIGSQWVYQKEGYSDVDTVNETSYNITFYGYGGDKLDYGNTHYEYQYITVGYTSKVMGNLDATVARAEDDLTNCYFGFYDLGHGLMLSPDIWESSGIFYAEHFQYSDRNNTATILDSFQVLNHTFRNVLCLKGLMGYNFSELYFVKNIGLVERRVTNYPAFLLKDWSIIKK